MDPATGRPRQDKRAREFECLYKVGEGAYGTVFKGTRRGDPRPVAIKVMRLNKEGVGIPLDAYREMKVCASPCSLSRLFVYFALSFALSLLL